MRYAVDRITAGTEKGVDANEFSSMSYIPFKLSRFFCPECGETVYWRAQGGTHSSHFFHKTKTETTPECDKRVDGRSELFIYERVGLPLYLSSVGRIFQLNIGFPSVGNDAISAAANRRISVKIASSTHNRTVMINQSNFIPDRMTLIPVNFVPINGENYKITTEGGFWYNRKWSDYADGFAYAGAIFSYGESGGKKIRRGDSISPSSHYYVVTKQLMSFYSEVQYSFVSNIRLNNDDYKIYEMAISISHKDAGRYSLISSYFREYYGVWLLDTVPEITPLWPPVVERDVLIPTTHNSLMCSVTTGNSEPSVFTYTGNVVNSLPVVTDKRNNHTLKISLLGNETIISVDRKYVGREVTIQKKKIHRHNSSLTQII